MAMDALGFDEKEVEILDDYEVSKLNRISLDEFCKLMGKSISRVTVKFKNRKGASELKKLWRDGDNYWVSVISEYIAYLEPKYKKSRRPFGI